MSEIITLYHGSTKIIERPEYGKGNARNDYGLGFYCSEDLELAKEWACGSRIGGFANIYSLDIFGLSVLELTDPQYGILDWLAILVNNRAFDITSQIAAEAKDYLTEYFLPDTGAFDAIRGYRADDSYFTFAMDFLSNTISLRQLNRAMALGSLGKQFMLKSKKSFNSIQFIRNEPADGEIYFAKRQKRDRQAREQYLKRERRTIQLRDDIFMLDILREEMKQGDARLHGGIPE
ncbi:MAG: DUF3990 domain-containing protein [Oscillospiraceae bacterium]|nr:DUF3990 domain-containing protein [Oscillospiraceae bacterium]